MWPIDPHNLHPYGLVKVPIRLSLHNYRHHIYPGVQCTTRDFHGAAKEVEWVTFLCKSVLFLALSGHQLPHSPIVSHSPEPLWDSCLSFSLPSSSPSWTPSLPLLWGVSSHTTPPPARPGFGKLLDPRSAILGKAGKRRSVLKPNLCGIT